MNSLPTAPEVSRAVDRARWFTEEVRPHEPMLRAWLHARFPSLIETDDLVQESYARLIRARENGQVKNAKSYLFTTALHAAFDLLRRKKVVSFEHVGEFDPLSVLDQRPDASEAASRNEELEILREAMHALPTRCRQVFTLRKLHGLSHREIAGQLDISEKTVEEQVNRAMRRCAAFLRSRGLP
ncbi:MAG: RNA polymerase sigma factor [Opitutaceae bacterium]